MANKNSAPAEDKSTAPLLPIGLDADADGVVDPRVAEVNQDLTDEQKVDVMMTDPMGEAEAQKASPAVASADDVVVEPLDIDNPQTDKAIDDIVAQEADQVLAAEDAGLQSAREQADAAAADDSEPHGHPIFWFFVALLVIIAAVAAYILMQPGLELPFLNQ